MEEPTQLVQQLDVSRVSQWLPARVRSSHEFEPDHLAETRKPRKGYPGGNAPLDAAHSGGGQADCQTDFHQAQGPIGASLTHFSTDIRDE
jgi:hypothetical protein